MRLLKELEKLNLPKDKFAIFGSGPLAVRNLRTANDLDLIVNDFIPKIWNPFLIQIMIVISNILTPLNVFLLASLFIGYLIYRREWYYGLLSFLALVSGTISLYLFKFLTGINRPSLSLIPTVNSSFPSGHATLITLFGVLVFHCLRRDMKNEFHRILLFCVATLMILLVGFSRIYLNAHWLSDVIAGYALGVFWVTFYILFLRGGNFFWKQIGKIASALLVLK